ncbi:MAG: family 78 glycoside hydrolase catalytic domain [bacterium]
MMSSTNNSNLGDGLLPFRLRCEYLVNPIGIDTPKPRFNWALQSDERGQMQTKYQIFVASSKDLLEEDIGNCWDSGEITSDEQLQIAYAGFLLAPRQRYFWRVRVWDKGGMISRDSEIAFFETGIMSEKWQAHWITRKSITTAEGFPLPLFRKVFYVDKPAKHARLYITSLGIHEVFINGKRVDDHLFDPIQSDFSMRVYYVTHDVTEYLADENNAIGIWLAKGWYEMSMNVHGVTMDYPAVMAQLVITYEDGSEQIVATNSTWKTSDSPITSTGECQYSNFGGEIYDATKEQHRWDTCRFDDELWDDAVEVTPPPIDISAQAVEPTRVKETVKPISSTQIGPDEYVFDMGKNMTGWFELQLFGLIGQKVRFEYFISQFGTDPELDEQMNQTDVYICSGKHDVFCSHFNYRVFRHVKVSGLTIQPTQVTATGYFIYTDNDLASVFDSSDATLNKLYQAVKLTHRCLNMSAVQVDCAHRERIGYGGDGQGALEHTLYNFDSGAFYTKWAQDFMDCQREDGNVMYTAPFRHPSGGGSIWSGACILYPWQMYRFYGDKRILTKHYNSMCKWIAFMDTKSKNNLLQYYKTPEDNVDNTHHIGDWASPSRFFDPNDQRKGDHYDPTVQFKASDEENEFLCCCMHFWNVVLVSRIAAIIGKQSEADAYAAKADGIKKAINETYFDASTSRYTKGEKQQAYLAVPLAIGLVPEGQHNKVLQNLIDDIEITRDGHLDTGILGTYYLIDTLVKEGRSDLIHLFTTNQTYPGYGFMMAMGACTIWEHWKPLFNWDRSSVHNCFMAIGSWFTQGLGGIKPTVEAPGFKHFNIYPQAIDKLDFVRSEYQSIRGRIVSEWKHNNSVFELDIKIPANTSATVFIPADKLDAITESGMTIAQSEGIDFVQLKDGIATLNVASGEYHFCSTLSQ